jgi:site-specific recombinase XerD
MAGNDLVLADLDEAMAAAFLAHIPTCRCVRRHAGQLPYCVAAVRRFLPWAREKGISATTRPNGTVPALIVEFESWMTRHRNIVASSLVCYRLQLRHFLDAVGDDPSKWNAAGIRQFILAQSQRTGISRTKQAVTAVRGLLRYLAIMGRCSPDLVAAPPTVANWRLSSLPVFIARTDVQRIIDGCNASTPAGRRDRAMLLLMARLGLRASDVACLRFKDIDWDAATVAVAGKSRRSSRLPLPQDVGDAILAWLHDGRPDHHGDHVFLRIYAPMGPVDASSVSVAAARAAARAGVALPRAGSHVLRHSAAVGLLDDGMSLPAIGALLRHGSLDTTAIYAKVDAGLLNSVARTWPGEVTA